MNALEQSQLADAAVPFTRSERVCVSEAWPVKIRSLGGFRVDGVDAAVVAAAKRPSKPLQLLQVLLALNPDGSNPRTLADELWPDADADAAYHAFEVTLQRLRRQLGRADALLLSAGRLRLNRAVCWLDLWTLDEVLRELDGGVPPDDPRGLAIRLLQCHRGEFLPGIDACWALTARWRITGRFTRAIEQLGTFIESDGDPEAVIDLYRRALEAEPLAEGLYRRCMMALAASGRQAEALALYQICENQFRARLATQPSEATRRQVEALRQTRL
jgi:LuxR family transcriptional regulator, maltose regulon positive regulatory protein